jgi:transcriptional regulator with XRE-family HTH domain
VKNIETLLTELSPERRREVEELAEAMVAVMQLAELREARGMTQAELADALQISQPAVSKIENGADLHLSTLNRYVRALGGTLHLEAIFPDQTVDLSLPLASRTEPLRSRRRP